MFEKIKGLMQTKIGGVPVLLIGGVLALGIALIYARKQAGGEDTEKPETDQPSPESDVVAIEENPVFTARVSTPSTGQTVITNVSSGDTNENWSRRAIEYLVSSGKSQGDASTAINQYLSGADITYEQGLMVDSATKVLGLPPDAPQSGRTGTYMGAPKRQFTPPGVHRVAGAYDNTFMALAELYYGVANQKTLNLLKAYNTGLKQIQYFPVGTQVTIPKDAPVYYKATSNSRLASTIAAKNGTTEGAVLLLNPNTKFPVRVGAKVRVK